MSKIISTKIIPGFECYVVEPVIKAVGYIADVRSGKLFELNDLPSCSPILRAWRKRKKSGPPSASMK